MPTETQVGGSHYKLMKIQPYEFVRENRLDAYQLNIIKYITRKKKDRLEDLKKARHVLDMYIQTLDMYPGWPSDLDEPAALA